MNRLKVIKRDMYGRAGFICCVAASWPGPDAKAATAMHAPVIHTEVQEPLIPRLFTPSVNPRLSKGKGARRAPFFLTTKFGSNYLLTHH